MSKNKRNKRSKEKKIKTFVEKMPNDLLIEKIGKAVEGLYYISETDAEILPFSGEKAEEISKEKILAQTKNSENSNVEERDFAHFFERLTKNQDWFGDEEIKNAQRFTELKNLLEENLRDIKVFKIGSIQLDIYVVGLDKENNLRGIKTKAVET